MIIKCKLFCFTARDYYPMNIHEPIYMFLYVNQITIKFVGFVWIVIVVVAVVITIDPVSCESLRADLKKKKVCVKKKLIYFETYTLVVQIVKMINLNNLILYLITCAHF